MKLLVQIALVARSEIYTRLTGWRVLVVALFLLSGVALPNLVLLGAAASAPGGEAASLAQSRARLVLQLYDRSTAEVLAGCPAEIVFFSVFLLVLLPLPVVILGADAVARDIERGMARLAFARISRRLWLAGKSLGLFSVVAILLLGLHTLAWAAGLALQREHFATAMWPWFPKLWLVTVAYAAPYVGIAVLASSMTRSSSLAALIGLSFLTLVWLLGLLARAEDLMALRGALPGGTDAGLLGSSAGSAAHSLGTILAWAAGSYTVSATSLTLREV